MQILVITDYLPYPLISGDRIRIYNLLRRVAKYHQITLVTPLLIPIEDNSIIQVRKFTSRIETAKVTRHNPMAHLPGLFSFAVQRKPLELNFLFSKELFAKIYQIAAETKFDIVQIEHSRMAYYLEALPPLTLAKKILTFHNVVSNQFERIAHIERKPVAKFRAWLYSREMRRWEPSYAEHFDSCVTVSEADRTSLLTANPRLRVNVIPNGVDTQAYQPLAMTVHKPILFFIGSMGYPPCADAAIYFCRQILPLIQQKIREVEVWIIGANPVPDVMALANSHIHVTGYVEDVVPYYEQGSISVVPLRAGGGTRLKILEAMALGRPVVTTSIGCEGIEVEDGKHLLIADQPEQFAQKTVDLLLDIDLFRRIVSEARRLVVEKYSWDRISEKLNSLYYE